MIKIDLDLIKHLSKITTNHIHSTGLKIFLKIEWDPNMFAQIFNQNFHILIK